jgi:carboxymethylenebutenolidase
MGKIIEFSRPDGQKVNAYLADTDRPDAPGVVVIQEWWGLNDQIKGVADKLAGAGFRALAPDLYRGELTLEAKEAEHLMNGLDFADAASQDIRGAVRYLLDSGSPKAGVTGFCMGGALTVLSAVLVPDSSANVVWYGYPPLDYVDAGKIGSPLMGHWGTDDQFFAIEGVDALERKLREAKVDFEFHRYAAKHAFANEEADAKNLPPLGYNPEAAALAWERTLTFLQQHLN